MSASARRQKPGRAAAPKINAATPPPTKGQRAYHELHAALLRGEFLPGTALTLRGLADRLGTSIMPVREAVSRLAAEQALELSPNRAITVPTLARADVDALWELRALIEGQAAAMAAAAATQTDIAALTDITTRMWEGLRRRRARDFVEGSGRWTMGLAAACHSAPFHFYISNLRLRCAPAIAQAFSDGLGTDDGFFRFTLLLQEQIIAALRGRDGVGARDLRVADVRSTQGYVYRRLGWRQG